MSSSSRCRFSSWTVRNPLEHFVGIEGRLRCGEPIGGTYRRLAIDISERVSLDAESLEVRPRTPQCDFTAVATYLVHLENGRDARDGACSLLMSRSTWPVLNNRGSLRGRESIPLRS